MDSTLSVSDIAQRIAQRAVPGYDIERLIRQIRHWTMNGIIAPVGGHLTGSGKHRQYPAEALFITAVLAEVARMGISISGLKAASNYLYRAVKHSDWNKAQRGDEQIYFYLNYQLLDDPKTLGKTSRGTASLIPSNKLGSLADPLVPLCGLVINLSALFARLRD